MRYLILPFLLLNISSYCQIISKQVIGSAGTGFKNGNSKLSYTAGEVVRGTMQDEDWNYIGSHFTDCQD